MPLQGTWASRWLSRYCEPGSHEFAANGPGERRCTICEKYELESGATCLVCGLPGSVQCVLQKANGATIVLNGLLCGPCQDDFEQAGTIQGWSMGRAG